MSAQTTNDEEAAMQAGFDSTEGDQSEIEGSSDHGSQHDDAACRPAGVLNRTWSRRRVRATSPSLIRSMVCPRQLETARRSPHTQAQLAATEERARRAEGQVRSLQGRFDSLATTPAPTQAPKLDKLQHAKETLGADMPEVVDALEELAALLPATKSASPTVDVPAAPAAPAKAPAQAPAQQAQEDSPHMVALDQVRPDWFETMESPDLKLWLTTQDPDLQATYHRAGTAGDVLKVLGEFDKYRQGIANRPIPVNRACCCAPEPRCCGRRPEWTRQGASTTARDD